MPASTDPALEPDRVRRYTSPDLLERIDEQIAHNVRFYAAQPPEVVAGRIAELKQEWSIERYLQVNVASAGFLTAFLALTSKRKWGLLTATAMAFFLNHGLRGFDPPMPVLRRMGVRTRREIDREMYALKAARGDFRDIPETHDGDPSLNRRVEQILEAVNR